MSGDLVNEQGIYGGLPSHDVHVAMELAEAYPAVPLRTLFAEWRHADQAIGIHAEDRVEIIVRLVEARLAEYAAGHPDGVL